MEKLTVDELLNKDINNKIIVFPTDTVYGVGCKIDDRESINKIYQMKARDYFKPFAILTPNKDLSDYVILNNKSKDIMDKYWPGALTIIFKKKKTINDFLTANLDTVGFRMPNSKIALTILERFGLLATTSINISGEAPLNNIEDIEREFGEYIDYLVVDKAETSNVSSTVIDCSNECFKILRQGDIKISI
ncbi:MAG: threonylcarbamoyl-AMP synthase [Bacilli bacterium]|nr:threonylcarbamoyl-AMP synthase [Bacilli bacterium]